MTKLVEFGGGPILSSKAPWLPLAQGRVDDLVPCGYRAHSASFLADGRKEVAFALALNRRLIYFKDRQAGEHLGIRSTQSTG
jgi:hypothetical protein